MTEPIAASEAALVAEGMRVVRRLLDERQHERDALSRRYHEWSNHPITLDAAQDNLSIFRAGYLLGLRGAGRLDEPYWTEHHDENGSYVDGPRADR